MLSRTVILRHRPNLPEVRTGRVVVYHRMALRLYGVSYSRASPRLFAGVIFVSYILRAVITDKMKFYCKYYC